MFLLEFLVVVVVVAVVVVVVVVVIVVSVLGIESVVGIRVSGVAGICLLVARLVLASVGLAEAGHVF